MSSATRAASPPKKPLFKDGKQVAVAVPRRRKPASSAAATHAKARRTHGAHGAAHSATQTHSAVTRRTTMPASQDRLVAVPEAHPLVLPATPPTGEVYAPPAIVAPAAAPVASSTAVPDMPVDNSPAGVVGPLSVTTPFAVVAHGRSALHNSAALHAFFAALAAHEAQPAAGTVRVMQWGDSHTAADMMSGEARAQMQARFGDGGVGYTYAGHPFAGYRILGSGRGQSAGWTTLGTHFTQLGDALLGMGGVAVETSRAGASVTLDGACTTLEVEYLVRAGGGGFQVAVDGATVGTVETEAGGSGTGLPVTSLPVADGAGAGAGGVDSSLPISGSPASSVAGAFRVACPPAAGPHHVALTTLEDAPVRLLGTVALQPGVTWEAMGINGAEAPLMLKWNQALFGQYLRDAAPQLIVLAYGTNEAAARYSEENYEAVFSRLIDTLHRDAPDASILVLGPGDRAIGSVSYTTVGRGRHKTRVAHHSYTPYAWTARIAAAQRAVCEAHGCAFWDWQARQGGLGSMQRWVTSGLGQPDHTHFTAAGYRTLADGLVADLLSAYEKSRE